MKLMAYDFEDDWFPHTNESIGFVEPQHSTSVVWRRVTDLYPQGVLYNGERLSYEACSQLSSRMAKLFTVFCLLSEFDEVMKRLLTWPLTAEGIFGVVFLINGGKEELIIDDYVPTINGKYLFGDLPLKSQLWPLLVEKALAKVLGNYHQIE